METPLDLGKDGRPSVIVVAGPTASGKSALATILAERLNGVVINADAMQVYRELPILTAAPTPSDRLRAPHRLYGVMSAAERCTVGRWRESALAEIGAAHGQRRLPIVVGGTGMYIKALQDGLAAVPPIPQAIRKKAHERLAVVGAAGMHAELAFLDPTMAARLSPGDSQRVLRAWQVRLATGRSLADFQRAIPPDPVARFITLLLLPPRETIHAAIARRCQAMMANGALDEVRRLIELNLDPTLPALKAVGVRELGRHLRGETTSAEALAAFVQATQQYAKRQVTWFRHQYVPVHTWHAQYSESLDTEMFPIIRKLIDAVPQSV
ncbi:MAG TPA: tRNA (adenosine(37)-N6)-dimethylallyltransferase MiaA [Alphaproteobacteria bacterium]|nr:tRNA (adenosine(37)-N6)-dimethylallyltransferase MiaA [Alphaproteobacteria bacterium]